MEADVMEVEVYIVVCSDGTYYTGITKDWSVRSHQHLSRQVSYTSTRLPINKVFSITMSNRRSAAKLERHIKTVGAAKWMVKQCQLVVFGEHNGYACISGSVDSQRRLELQILFATK